MSFVPNILSIAGSDPSGGAGLQADLKVFTALGCYGMAVPTALTAQNTCGVRDVHGVPAAFVEAQLRAVFEDVRVEAVKIGMLGSADIVRVVAKILEEYNPAYIILDPVMVATSGDALAGDDVVEAMRTYLMSHASVLTPNIPEAARLLGRDVIDMEADAQALLPLGAQHILLKGGHMEHADGLMRDVLAGPDGVQVFSMPRIDAHELHGTGCSLSSALACYLALGFDMAQATRAAQNYIAHSIQGYQKLDAGNGAQPLYHGYAVDMARAPALRVGEFDLIAQYFAPLSLDGLQNDGAVLDVPEGMELVVSTDTLNESVHFMKDAAPGDIAAKVLRVNLSDLASMGAQPMAYQLSLSLPQGGYDALWYKDFAAALEAEQEEFGIALSGGDTTSNLGGGLSVSITVFGLVPKGQALQRSGAQVGDVLCVTGTVGDALLGLDVLRGADLPEAEYLISRYTHPTPRVSVGLMLQHCARACVDVSDGVLADVEHMAKASGVKAVIDLQAVPLSEAACAVGGDPLRALAGGDDYELAFAVPAEGVEAVRAAAQALGVPVSVVGCFEAGAGVEVRDAQGEPIDIDYKGWVHF